MDEEVREIFSKFDKNGDGKISTTELKEKLLTLDPKTTSEEADCIMTEIDKNGDGFIDLKEFAEFYSTKAKDGADVTVELREAFDLFDLDKNGVITASELRSVLRKLGEECSLSDCQRMISCIDEDGDGNVNFEEFKKMMSEP